MNFFSTLCKTLTRRTASLFCTLLICLCQSSALSSRCESWLTCLKFAKGCEKSETWFRNALIRISRTVLIRQAKKHIWFLMSQPLTLLCVPAPPATNKRKSWNRTNLMASPIPSQSEDIGRSMWLSAEIRTNLLSFSVKHNAIVTFDLVLEKNEKKKSKELEVSRKNAKNSTPSSCVALQLISFSRHRLDLDDFFSTCTPHVNRSRFYLFLFLVSLLFLLALLLHSSKHPLHHPFRQNVHHPMMSWEESFDVRWFSSEISSIRGTNYVIFFTL